MVTDNSKKILITLLRKLKKIMYNVFLAQCLQQIKHFINVTCYCYFVLLFNKK